MLAPDAASAGRVVLTGRSGKDDPADALREALRAVAEQMAGAGAGPHHLTEMIWATADVAAFHPSRRTVDAAYREVFAGFRPKLLLTRTSVPGLVVTAHVAPPKPPDPHPVWRTYSVQQLAQQYSPRSQVPDAMAVFEQWTRDGTAFRAGHRGLDLAYGREAAARFDLYRPADMTRPPLFVFIHGGYWQAITKEQNAQFAAGLVRSGFAIANLDYSLCPETPLPQIVLQIRAALNMLRREADNLCVDASRLHLIGHSAGAHLAAMLTADPDSPPIASALLISGVFELKPLALLPMGQILGLTDPAVVRRNSPINFRPRPGCRVGVAVGGRESDEFKRQSTDLATTWRTDPPHIVAERNHFDILDGLIEGDLLQLALKLAK
jgi:arylformamidase